MPAPAEDVALLNHPDALAKLLARVQSEAPHGNLVHYTSMAAAQSILGTGEIWATHPRYLNDELELLYFLSPLEDAYGQLAWERRGDATASEVMDALGAAIFDTFDIDEFQTAETYVACFCEEPDLLSQWRGYGGTEGPAYSLAFDARHLSQAQAITEPSRASKPPPEAGSPDTQALVSILPVVYNKWTQREWLRDYLLPAVNGFIGVARGRNLSSEAISGAARSIADSLIMDLLDYPAVAFKSAGFAEEAEWRLVVRVDSPILASPPVFRPTRLGLAPYRRVRLFGKNNEPALLPLDRVTQGPVREPALGVSSMNHYLETVGYARNVAVTGSTISYRV